jgi:hypothetical protein
MNKKLIIFGMMLLPVMVLAGAFSLTEENDTFAPSSSDRRYTQGLELMWLDNVNLRSNGRSVRMGYGLRNLIYTPADISISEPQPDDRPWAGITAGTVTRWVESKKGVFNRFDVMVGVAGEASGSDFIQTEFHKVIDSQEPMGWDNQIPSEFVLNCTFQEWRPIWRFGGWSDISGDVSLIYGGSLGTAFINAFGGLEARIGWNVPISRIGVIKPTEVPGMYVYLTASGSGKAVLHNVTLGGSFFHDWEGQDMNWDVAETSVGVVVGWESLYHGMDVELSYTVSGRTEEFEGQGGHHEWGTIHIGVGRML